MNPKNRLLAASLVFAFATALLHHVASAQDKIDVSNAGQAKSKQETLAWLAANKPTAPLIVPDVFFTAKFDQTYTFDIPANPPLMPVAQPGSKATLRGAGTIYKYHVAKELRDTMLAIAASPAENVFDLWLNDKEPELYAKLGKPPFPASVSPVIRLFLKDWYDEVMKSVNLENDETAKTTKFKEALKQAAYQFTSTAVDFQKKDEAITASKAVVGSSVETSLRGAGSPPTGSTGGYHFADVVHERLMNGIYRRHNRNMNKIERIRARR